MLRLKFQRIADELNAYGIGVMLVGEDGLPIFSTYGGDELAAMCSVIAFTAEKSMSELGKELNYVVVSSSDGGIVITKLTSSYLALIYPTNEKLGLTLFFMRKLKRELGETF